PRMNVARVGNDVVISWPTNSGFLTIQSATTLAPADWISLAQQPDVVGTNYQVSLPISPVNVFFRLKYLASGSSSVGPGAPWLRNRAFYDISVTETHFTNLMPLTAAQQQATSAQGNVLVVAGAGTGKTSTLVERCMNCLIEASPPASI